MFTENAPNDRTCQKHCTHPCGDCEAVICCNCPRTWEPVPEPSQEAPVDDTERIMENGQCDG